MRRPPGWLLMTLAVLLSNSTVALGQYDLSGSAWDLPEAGVRQVVRVSGLGKHLVDEPRDVQLVFDQSTWSLSAVEQWGVAGPWSSTQASGRRADLQLDDSSKMAWAERLADAARSQAEAAGLADVVVTAEPRKQRLRVRLRPSLQLGTATSRLRVVYRARGTVSGSQNGVAVTRKWNARLVIKAESTPVPLGSVQVLDDGQLLPPAAEFAMGATVGSAPFTVHFGNGSSGTISAFLWTFGDGTASTQVHPVHTFTQAGTYEVQLTASGPLGQDSHIRFVTVTPGNVAPSPQTTLYPAFTGDNLNNHELLDELTFSSWFFESVPSGFSSNYARTLTGTSNGSRGYQIWLGMDSVKPQTFTAALLLYPQEGEPRTLMGPVVFITKGSGPAQDKKEFFHVSTLTGPVLEFEPGDRLRLEVENVSEPGGTFLANLRLHLGWSWIKLPELLEAAP